MAEHHNDGSMLSALLTAGALFLNAYNWMKGDNISLFIGIVVGILAAINHLFTLITKIKAYRDARKNNSKTE